MKQGFLLILFVFVFLFNCADKKTHQADDEGVTMKRLEPIEIKTKE
jgi:hypothetical protein